jgi:drug/metabolite transporter (DMT)-like permease
MLATLSRQRHALALTAAAASWGIATVIAKRAVAEIPPIKLLPIQLVSSLALLAPVLALRRHDLAWSPDLRRLGALGVLNPGIAYAFSMLGLAQIAASLSVLLWATEPLLILLLAWWILGERISRRLIAAAALAMLGVLLVVFESGRTGRPLGIVLTLAGVGACAVYTVTARKWITSESSIQVVTLQQGAALAFALLLLGAMSSSTGSGISNVSATAWISAIVSGLLYYGAAFWLYLTGLRHVPAAWAGLFINLIPVFGVAAGIRFLDERLSPRQWLGAALILTTMSLVTHGQGVTED